MQSKTPLVRLLLIIRPIFISVWSCTPKWLSSFLLRWFRYGDGYLSFGVRYLAVYRLAKSCGEKVIVFPGVYLKNINNLSIGTNVSIHEMTYINAYGGVKIGNDVAISHGVSMLSYDHDIYSNSSSFKDANPVIGRIEIGNNVWIGAGVRILKNVEIEKDCVIAAGAVVTRSIKENSIAAGIPAKIIKSSKKT